jgi:predicted class III extradiol MEMO1 family dioxygenase
MIVDTYMSKFNHEHSTDIMKLKLTIKKEYRYIYINIICSHLVDCIYNVQSDTDCSCAPYRYINGATSSEYNWNKIIINDDFIEYDLEENVLFYFFLDTDVMGTICMFNSSSISSSIKYKYDVMCNCRNVAVAIQRSKRNNRKMNH